MVMTRFLRFGFTAAVLGGLLLALGAGWSILGSDQPFSDQAGTTAFALSAALRMIGAYLMILGVTAIAVRQADDAGRFGLVAYALVIANMVLQLGWMWSDTFLSGVIADQAPGILDGTIDESRLTAGFLIAWLMNSTFILLGIAVLRAKVFPRTVGWGLVAAGAITVVPLPVDGPVYEIAIGLSFAVAGWASRSRGSAETGLSAAHSDLAV
jgi:hypothetical protein